VTKSISHTFIRFFSSVKLAVTLFIIVVLVCIVGTLIPQERSFGEYLSRYGEWAQVLWALDLTRLYHSWWFMGLLFFFSINIIVCTLNRFLPTLKAVVTPRVTIDERTIEHLPHKVTFPFSDKKEASAEKVKAILASHRYRLYEEPNGGGIHLLAQKGSMARFGADVVHLSILLILLGAIIGNIGGYKDFLMVPEGSVSELPQESFRVRVDDFWMEYYPNGAIKDWKSKLTILEDGQEKVTRIIEVNHPLHYKGVRFYQSSYSWDWGQTSMIIAAAREGSPIVRCKAMVGDTFLIPPTNLEVKVVSFVPDYAIGEGGRVVSRSHIPYNPAVLLEGRDGGEVKFRQWVFAEASPSHSGTNGDYRFELEGFWAPELTGLQINKDPGVPLIWTGCGTIMVGLLLSFYLSHRRIRILIEKDGAAGKITIGGSANKNQAGFEKEIGRVTEEIKGALRKCTISPFF